MHEDLIARPKKGVCGEDLIARPKNLYTPRSMRDLNSTHADLEISMD